MTWPKEMSSQKRNEIKKAIMERCKERERRGRHERMLVLIAGLLFTEPFEA